MKIRVIAIIYTLVILACGLFLWSRINKETAFNIDMLDLNTKVDDITDRLNSGASRESLESQYYCKITFLSDDNYDSVNNNFIREGYSVFDYAEGGAIKGKIAFDARSQEHDTLVKKSQDQLFWTMGIVYAAGIVLLLVIWYFYVRPFNKLSYFAASVSKGNLDVPLNMDKHNYFGAFTESFDRMREELKLSSEREAGRTGARRNWLQSSHTTSRRRSQR